MRWRGLDITMVTRWKENETDSKDANDFMDVVS